MKTFDVTATLTPNIAVFPGDPPFQEKMLREHGFVLKEFCFANHTGTHIDFPKHIFPEGKTSSDFSLDDLCGHCLVIEVSSIDVITLEDIGKATMQENDIVFFKTRNTSIPKNIYTDNYVSINHDAAQYLVDKKVRLVGIDYLSVDAVHDEALTVHHLLLSHDILIVENLDLSQVKAGNYHAQIYPLKVANADGLPVRVSITEK